MLRSHEVTVLRDVVKSIGEDAKLKQQFNISGSHGDGRVDFIIM